jgi:hypothetical protein
MIHRGQRHGAIAISAVIAAINVKVALYLRFMLISSKSFSVRIIALWYWLGVGG